MKPRYLQHGRNVLRLIEELPGTPPSVVIIRHSERPSFEGFSSNSIENIGLTKEGLEDSLMFGRLMGQLKSFESLNILSWGSKRCSQTALAIYEGAKETCDGDLLISEPKMLCLNSPISDQAEYSNAVNSGNFQQMIKDWLDNDTSTALFPIKDYAKTISKEILSCTFDDLTKISVLVTHDLNVAPIIRLFFPSAPFWPLDFLDGIVFKANSNKISVGFDGEKITVAASELI